MPDKKSLSAIVVKCVLGVTLCGIVQGSLLLTRESAQTATIVGGSIVGLMGLLLGVRAGRVFGAMTQKSSVVAIGGLMGAIIGTITGATIGVLIAAFLGTLLGAIGGAALGRVLNYCGLKQVKIALAAFLGALAGAVGLAFYTDQDAALTGALHGAWIGAIAGFGLLLLLLLFAAMLSISRRPKRA